jgi:hypothetical protein
MSTHKAGMKGTGEIEGKGNGEGHTNSHFSGGNDSTEISKGCLCPMMGMVPV